MKGPDGTAHPIDPPAPLDAGGTGQPLVVSIYVLIAMAGEAIFIVWLLTPLFAQLLA